MNGGDGSLNWKMRGRETERREEGARKGGRGGIGVGGGDIGDRKLTETKLFRNGGIRRARGEGERLLCRPVNRALFLSFYVAPSLLKERVEKLGH